jgi:purine-binding chemotaxis protein CheW
MSKKEMIDLNDEVDSLQDDEDETVEDMYLTFELGDEVYGIGIAHVTEIVGIQNITEVPDMPDFVKGVVNLRGQVIPVVDVRLRFHMQAKEYDERTCIIVVDIGSVQLGLVVDTVNEVMTIDDAQISPPPKIAAANSARYIKGMGKVGEEVKILLDGEKLLFEEEVAALGA